MTALEILRQGGNFDAYAKLPKLPAPSPELIARERSVATAAAEILKKEFGADRVVLHGSLAREDDFSSTSDIDIVAWGIPLDRFFAAVSRLDDFCAAWEIDLFSGELADDFMQAALLRDGIEL